MFSMSSKTITIREDVYEKLSRVKGERSFSELLESLVDEKRVDLEDSFGSWSSEEAEETRDKIREFREDFDSDFGEEVES